MLAKEIAKRPYAHGQREARTLVEHVTGFDSGAQIGAAFDPLPDDQLTVLDGLLTRRLAGVPLARLIGKASFWDFEVALNDATLVPRDDSAVLVDAALDVLPIDAPSYVADLGTGSGILLLALARERPCLHGVGVDVSSRAVEQAAANAMHLGLDDRLRFCSGSWLESVEGPFDMIVSNPPYIRQSEMDGLTAEVRDHDPVLALVAGEDGLDAYRDLLPQAADKVKPGGAVLVEIGYDQARAVTHVGEQAGLILKAVLTDGAGHDRVVHFHRDG